jgi:hypothetical protein
MLTDPARHDHLERAEETQLHAPNDSDQHHDHQPRFARRHHRIDSFAHLFRGGQLISVPFPAYFSLVGTAGFEPATPACKFCPFRPPPRVSVSDVRRRLSAARCGQLAEIR